MFFRAGLARALRPSLQKKNPLRNPLSAIVTVEVMGRPETGSSQENRGLAKGAGLRTTNFAFVHYPNKFQIANELDPQGRPTGKTLLLPTLDRLWENPGVDGVAAGKSNNNGVELTMTKVSIAERDGIIIPPSVTKELGPLPLRGQMYHLESYVISYPTRLKGKKRARMHAWMIPQIQGKGTQARTVLSCDKYGYQQFLLKLMAHDKVHKPSALVLHTLMERRLGLLEKYQNRDENPWTRERIKAVNSSVEFLSVTYEETFKKEYHPQDLSYASKAADSKDLVDVPFPAQDGAPEGLEEEDEDLDLPDEDEEEDE